VRDRAAAVNRAFTNGTPMSVVVAALGTNYILCGKSARVWLGPGPEPPNTFWLSYRFGGGEVTIGTSAVFGRDVDVLSCGFTGAQPANRIRIGQGGAADGSQPIRSETNFVKRGSAWKRSPQAMTDDYIYAAVVRWIVASDGAQDYFIGYKFLNRIVEGPEPNELYEDANPLLMHLLEDRAPRVRPLSAYHGAGKRIIFSGAFEFSGRTHVLATVTAEQEICHPTDQFIVELKQGQWQVIGVEPTFFK
jgi:hypothetical protein